MMGYEWKLGNYAWEGNRIARYGVIMATKNKCPDIPGEYGNNETRICKVKGGFSELNAYASPLVDGKTRTFGGNSIKNRLKQCPLKRVEREIRNYLRHR